MDTGIPNWDSSSLALIVLSISRIKKRISLTMATVCWSEPKGAANNMLSTSRCPSRLVEPSQTYLLARWLLTLAPWVRPGKSPGACRPSEIATIDGA